MTTRLDGQLKREIAVDGKKYTLTISPKCLHLAPSRLMQNPLGAAFARKVLRCKAPDEGRMLVLFDEERNAAAGHFSCKPFGAVLCGAICFVASLANSPAIRLRLASRISPREASPRPHGVLHQPAKGKRKGYELAWQSVITGQAALVTALNESLRLIPTLEAPRRTKSLTQAGKRKRRRINVASSVLLR